MTGEAVPFDLPAVGFLRDQPARLPLLGEHDPEWLLGAVGHLERSKQDGLMMVGRIVHDDFAELLADTGPWYLSAGVRARRVGTHALRARQAPLGVSGAPPRGHCHPSGLLVTRRHRHRQRRAPSDAVATGTARGRGRMTA